ncbi:carbohydrate ABC transporter permease [Streptosporangiaceae bacterium NEAU-GS5]|nr:carbohydrate ABC transporter permease [Streptosporangiaceae bacterium NEAU-GS5]
MTLIRSVAKYGALAVGAALVLLPLVWMVTASISPEASIVRYPPSLIPGGFTTEHYAEVWRRIPFARQLLNTVIFAGGVTAVSLVLDSLAAYALARLDFPGKNAVFALILLLLMIPPQVTLVPLFQLLSDLGWINTYQGLIVPRATNAFGIFFLRQFFMTIPLSLGEAARIDGASEFGIYRRIILPLSGPALLTLGLFHFMYNWNDLLWPLVFTTDTDMQTLPAGLALFMGQHVIEYGLLMAGAVLTLLPMVSAFLLVQRRFVEGIATTGLR